MSHIKARILVVDDEEATRYFVARTLRAEGHEILEAATGHRALELARRAEPDLVLLDVRLPDILGFEVAERLKADEATRSIAILQLSASFTDADAQIQGLERGADGYLTHPVDGPVLCATVQALLRMRRAEQREKLARERAEASERQYRFLADMVPQMVWTRDAAGRLDYVNRRWLEFAGAPADGAERDSDVAPLDTDDPLHPEDRQPYLTAWQHARETGTPLEIECRRWSVPAKSFRWLLVRAMPMRDDTGNVIRWFGTSTDVENQKQELAAREQLLKEARGLAAERERLIAALHEEGNRKNEFLAILSHELRNPLTPIRNSLYILERATPDGEQAKRAREVIDRQTHQMTRLIDDLLDITRITRNKIRLHREPVELNGLLRRSTEDHREHFRRKNISLEVRGWDLPLTVDGDPTRLAQVIGNLLQNAAKFTPSGGKVVLSLHLESPSVAIVRVCDTGAGMASDTLNRIFQPFVQADRTLDRSGGGLGLGLALAKGILELHGGTISAHSEGPGRGSEFLVRLPLEAASGRKLSLVPGAPTPNLTRRVLIIEDNLDAAQTLREVLELADHSVEIARDGTEGLAKARSFEPDIVLCDIGLPILDGYAVARQMRADPRLRSTFLVALSGYALNEDVERSKQAGFDRHIAKPASMEVIKSLLDEAQTKRVSDPPPASAQLA
ncbi:MAG TPA: response regulator [Polyangiaceae bacterium]|nr:response regulator [Polyangiaceae bacterium]